MGLLLFGTKFMSCFETKKEVNPDPGAEQNDFNPFFCTYG